MHEGESHEPLLVSNLLELKQNCIILKQKNEEKDIKLQRLRNDVEDLKALCYSFSKMDIMSWREELAATKEEVANLKDAVSRLQSPILVGGVKLKKQVDKLSVKVIDMEKEFLEYSKECSKSLADMGNRTLNGELIWIIDKLELRMAHAKLGEVTMLHSAPCYTKQHEYKYCARLHLNGDGIGEKTHISLYFILMKSQFDEILPWPMQKSITIQLLNFKNEADSVIQRYVSNSKSSNFQRPTENMNVALCYPTLIPIEQFLNGGFIQDNCVFIRVTVKDVWCHFSR